MATRVVPTSLDADNPAGSFMLAACSDWRSGVRRFHVGTGLHEPTSDAGYTTAGSPLLPQLSINLLPCGGSPYTTRRHGQPSRRSSNTHRDPLPPRTLRGYAPPDSARIHAT